MSKLNHIFGLMFPILSFITKIGTIQFAEKINYILVIKQLNFNYFNHPLTLFS